VLEFLSLAPAMGRPFFMPPRTPDDRVAAVRKAFNATMIDPAFISDAQKSRLDLTPVTGEELQKIVIETLQASANVRAIAAKAME
jgi:tripartite-type tricarboxylate transporter receptor subunit TctC